MSKQHPIVMKLIGGLAVVGGLMATGAGVAQADTIITTDQMAAKLHSLGVPGGPGYLVGVAEEACEYINAGDDAVVASSKLAAAEMSGTAGAGLTHGQAGMVVVTVITERWC